MLHRLTPRNLFTLGAALCGVLCAAACAVDADDMDDVELGDEPRVTEQVAPLPDPDQEPVPPPASSYTCMIGINCAAPHVSVTSLGSNRYVAAVNMGSNQFRRMDVFAWIDNPSGWTLHVADSPTDNGFGGDGSSTDHDAEGYLYNSTAVGYFDAFNMLQSPPTAFSHHSASAYPAGSTLAHFIAHHAAGAPAGTFAYDRGPNTTRVSVSSTFGVKLGYSACATSTSTGRAQWCDWEDRDLGDSNLWYVGVNRTVGDESRSGSGAIQVCVVLSADVTSEPKSCIVNPFD